MTDTWSLYPLSPGLGDTIIDWQLGLLEGMCSGRLGICFLIQVTKALSTYDLKDEGNDSDSSHNELWDYWWAEILYYRREKQGVLWDGGMEA